MRAIHKYNPKDPEGARRIAQSMGYKFSIYDMPQMIALLYRAGIEINGVDYDTIDNIIPDSEVSPDMYIPDTAKIEI